MAHLRLCRDRARLMAQTMQRILAQCAGRLHVIEQDPAATEQTRWPARHRCHAATPTPQPDWWAPYAAEFPHWRAWQRTREFWARLPGTMSVHHAEDPATLARQIRAASTHKGL
jgi:hypothetical protein